MFDVVLDGEVVAGVKKNLVGARLLALITEHPNVPHHVLVLLSALNGGVSELYIGPSELSDIRALAARLGIQQSIPGELRREQMKRTGALLRRLEVVRAEIQGGSTRKKRPLCQQG